MKHPDVSTALRIYYENTEIGNAEIKRLFGTASSSSLVKLKNQARELMKEKMIDTWNPNNVNTAVAYEAWNLDISDLERRHKKLKTLGMTSSSDADASLKTG